MNTASSGVETVKALADQLHGIGTKGVPPFALLQLGSFRRVQYLGHGRELRINDASFGIYARGARHDDSWLTHEVHIDFVSPPDARKVRQNLGHISLGVRGDGKLDLSTHGFDKQNPGQRIPIQTLAAPLGKWVTNAAAQSEHANAEARASQTFPERVPLSATSEELEPLAAFVNDRASIGRFFRFAYENSVAVGILTT